MLGNYLYSILFLQMVVHSLFLGDYTSFQLRFQSLVSISRAGKILVYNYQLRCPLQGLFGTLLSFQRSSNMVRVFLHQGYDLAALLFMGAMMQGFSTNILPHHFFSGAFHLGIFLKCIFTISWLVSTISILFTSSNCFLQPFNHSAWWLYSFLILQISFQNLILSSEFGIVLSHCFYLFSPLYTCFWLT